MEMQDELKTEKIDLVRLINSALRHVRYTWPFAILLMAVLAAAGVFLTFRSYSPQYKVSASFVVNAASSSDSTAYSYTNSETAKQLNETFPYVLTSGALSKIVAEDLGYSSLPVRVTAEALAETNIFRITVTGAEAQLCMNALNSLIENYPEVAKYILGSTKLELLSMSSLPTRPYTSPDYTGNALKFAALGLLIYLAFTALRALTNRTVYSKSQLARYISVPILGSIPKIGSQKKTRRSPIQIASGAVSGQYREAMETLRLRVSSKLEHRKWRSMYVTSSMAGEGKTTMACNLAVLMAQHDHRVILVDADLRNPSVARTMSLDKEKDTPGLNNFLLGETPLDQLLMKTDVPNLLVIPGGKAVDRVDDQFSNGRFEKMIHALTKRADLVIVDTPPCAMMDDAVIAADHLDGGLLVVRREYASVDAVIAGSEMLSKTRAPLFGCAINFAEAE